MIADLVFSQLRRYTEYNHYDNPENAETASFKAGDIFIDPPRHMVKVRGQPVNLRPREFSLLLYFMRNINIVLTAEQICENAWGMGGSYNHGVSGPIAILRKAIEPDTAHLKYIETVSHMASYEQELKAATARISELEKLMQNLYEDKCTGVIPQTVFQTLMSKYETERAQKTESLTELEQKARTQLAARQEAGHWAEIIRQYTEITELDETILFALVDRIEVGEAVRRGPMRICDVKVFYRYVGNVDEVVPQEGRDAG